MNLYEEFLRCPACGHPYFKEEKQIIIDKESFEKLNKVEKMEERITYICLKCNKELNPFERKN